MSGYGTLVRFAKELGQKAIPNKVQKNLDEEYKADDNLDKLAEGRINKKAK
ncbi:MAG: DUF892 family protein [Salegentibacter sp.]|uniref:DUF892 family protein n=1 Tax=Salegentibacter TaxID=143222 RepID=UPI000B8703F2|nr:MULTISPECIES: DUF892 family protein [Salegentibacter]MDR9458185.1 DUF892 family protein [Salegentibacter sp.]